MLIRIRSTRPAVMLLLTMMMVAGAASAEQGKFAAVDAFAEKAVADGKTPSLAFAIARDGKILHEGAFGMADREAGRVATVHTAYPLASATKPITATALMRLHERKGLDLKQPLRQALPDLQVRGANAQDITLTHLLTHTSGLGTYARIRYGEATDRAPPLLQDVAAYAITVNAPGRIAEYSNLGYGLLGEVIARHTKRPFASAMETLVFAPLGMDDAYIDTPQRGQTDIAAHYDAALQRLPPLRNNTPGAGNAYASARDLIRFAMLHAGASGKQPLSAAGVATMQARHDSAFHHYYGDASYGLGWYVRSDDGRRVVWHEGGMPGASTIIKLLPDQHIAVVVLGNSSDANALTQAIADQLIHSALPDYTGKPLDPIAAYTPLTTQPGFAGSWRGTIKVGDIDVKTTLTIAADGNATLRYQVPGQTESESPVRAIVNGDSLVSAIPGRLPSPDIAATDEPLLLLKLVRNGEHFSGAVVAYSSLARLEYLLPHRVELQRETPP